MLSLVSNVVISMYAEAFIHLTCIVSFVASCDGVHPLRNPPFDQAGDYVHVNLSNYEADLTTVLTLDSHMYPISIPIDPSFKILAVAPLFSPYAFD